MYNTGRPRTAPKWPCAILRQSRRLPLGGERWPQPGTVSLYEIVTDVLQQFFDRGAPVISRDVVVQVFPGALDRVVVRTVWRQEVQAELAACVLQAQVHD